MNVLEWYAAFGGCVGTPVAAWITAEYMIEADKWPAWTRTASGVLAAVAWILGLGYILQAS